MANLAGIPVHYEEALSHDENGVAIADIKVILLVV
jgi:hypothetical protein